MNYGEPCVVIEPEAFAKITEPEMLSWVMRALEEQLWRERRMPLGLPVVDREGLGGVHLFTLSSMDIPEWVAERIDKLEETRDRLMEALVKTDPGVNSVTA